MIRKLDIEKLNKALSSGKPAGKFIGQVGHHWVAVKNTSRAVETKLRAFKNQKEAMQWLERGKKC